MQDLWFTSFFPRGVAGWRSIRALAHKLEKGRGGRSLCLVLAEKRSYVFTVLPFICN